MYPKGSRTVYLEWAFMERQHNRHWHSSELAQPGQVFLSCQDCPDYQKPINKTPLDERRYYSSLQRSVSVRSRAEVIITHAPSMSDACETHAQPRREVYCQPSPSALLTISDAVLTISPNSRPFIRSVTDLLSSPGSSFSDLSSMISLKNWVIQTGYLSQVLGPLGR